MNKIFKVVWSKVKHCYVVVSEIAKNTISGGARRCRIRKGALAAALVTTVLGSSFVMPNSAWAEWNSEWNKWRPTDYNDKNKSYDDASHGNSYEAMVVLSATTQDNGTGLGIVLYRGDKISDGGSHLSANAEYLHPSDAHAALGELWNKDYAYTKIENSATAEFDQILNQTINQTVVNDIVTMINSGQNAVAIPTYSKTQKTDSSGKPLYYDDAGNETTVKTNNPIYPIEGYTVHSADSKVISLANSVSGNDNNGTLATAITQKEAVLDNQGRPIYEDGKIKYEDKVYTDNITYVSGGGAAVTSSDGNGATTTTYKDTYITISDGTNSFNLETGSKVVGITANDSNALTGLEINGEPFTISATDTKLVGNSSALTLDQNTGEVSMLVQDTSTDSNDVTGRFNLKDYIKQVAGEGTSGNTTINQQISQNINNITNLTKTVNDGWVAKIGDTIVKEVKPDSNELSFVAGENVTLENENGAIKINARLNSGGSSEIDLNAGENIKLDNNNPNGSITIIADIKGEGYKADWQQQRLMASAQDDSGQEVTGKPTYEYEGQLQQLRIGNKVYDVPVISVIDGVDSDALLLKAVELNGQKYRIADPAWTVKVANDGGVSSFDITDTDAVEYVAGSNIVLSAEATSDESGVSTGGKIVVSTAKNVVFDCVTVGSNVVINNSGIAMGNQKITGLKAGEADTDAVNFGQLKSYVTGVDKYLVTNPDPNAANGEYTVVENKVTLKVKNGEDDNGDDTYTDVVIDGIASKTELVELAERVDKVTTEASKKTTVTGSSNITVTPAADSSKANEYNVALNNDITLTTKDANDNVTGQVEIKSSDSTVTVGTDAAKQVSIDGAKGTVAVGENVFINANGSASFDKVSIDGANGSIKAGNVTVNTNNNGTINGLTNKEWGGNYQYVSGQAATEDQLHKAVTTINTNINAAKTEVNGGENIKVASEPGSNGQTIYTVSGTDTIKSGEVNVAGDGSITLEHVNAEGKANGLSTKIVGLHDYVIDKQTQKVTDGEVTLKVTDKYNSKNTYDVKITDVASASKLQEVETQVSNNSTAIEKNTADITNLYNNDQILSDTISKNANRINQLGNRMNKVGAGSAALAALHPMDFDPDDKLQFSAGVGHYGGENAAALGAFYRPTEKVMFSVAGTMGNGEDMVNAGVTFALDKPNNVSNSRVAMAREIQDLRQQVAALTMLVMQMASRDNAALAGVAMFPDVPENHWAYDYIEGLQKQGIIEGYPDGNFGGDRSMTRYEFAAMLYRALEKGFPVDSRLLNEFNAELGRIRVDRIKGADNDANKVERVRVNNYEDRDDYGSKIVQVKAGA